MKRFYALCRWSKQILEVVENDIAQINISRKVPKATAKSDSGKSSRELVVNHFARNHWSITNRLHWKLDVVFRQDQARTKTAHVP